MKNANPKWNLKEYTSEFILDGSNQFAFTFPILMIPIYFAFTGRPLLLVIYFSLLGFFFFAFYFLSKVRKGDIALRHKKNVPWAFRPLPNAKTTSSPTFLRDYGFGSTAVFLTIASPMIYLAVLVLLGRITHNGFWFFFICVVGWDLGIYLFSIAAGMEKHHTAWMRDFLTKDMNGAEYKQFLRNEYLAEKGRAAGFNEGYMVGRNSRN